LMVQGWRRYSWKQMTDVETDNYPSLLKYLPEQGIETNGRVVNINLRGNQVPKPNVDVGLFLQKSREDNETGGSFIETFVTDDDGRFSFSSDVSGKWSMILTVKEKGKPKLYQILLDRVFSPEPKRYRYADLQIHIAEKNTEHINDDETPEETEDDSESFLVAYRDSIAKLGIDEKVHLIPEVTIKGKRRTKEQDILRNRSTSIAYYDVASEYDDLYDRGKYVGRDIHELMKNMNNNFYTTRYGNYEFLEYKGKLVLFVVNYERTEWSELGYFKYKMIGLNAIKSIYINENLSVMCSYADPKLCCGKTGFCLSVEALFSCVVFIETYPEGQIPVDGAKGVRKTWLEGYSPVKEFYSPNYSELPPQIDYRRTLFWNPMVTPDENGKVKIQFYNNSSCTNFSISAETVTLQGIIGIYKDD